jgi:hypothetical protein
MLWCHQLLSKFLAKGYLPRGSRQSRLLANDKGNNEKIPGAVHRYPGIHFIAEEIPVIPQLGDYGRRLATSHCLKWGEIPPNEVGRIAHSTSGIM